MKNFKKILIFGNKSRSLVNFRFELISSLISEGYEVHAFLPDNYPNIENELVLINVKTHRGFISNKNNFFSEIIKFSLLIKVLYQLRPNSLIIYNFKSMLLGVIACSFFKIDNIFLIVTGTGRFFSNSNYLSKCLTSPLKFIYHYLFHRAKIVFFQNNDDLNLFYKEKYNSSFFLINGSGVNTEKFKFNVNNLKNITFTMVSRLIKEKGILEFLRAAEMIKEENKNILFILAGHVPKNKKLRHRIEKLHDNNTINYLGFVENIVPVLDQTSVFVLPSYYREGVPRAVLEAMSSGRAIITTNLPGCRETIIEGKNGYFVKEKDTQDLYIKMLNFIADPNKIKIMGFESRKLAEQKFEVSKVNKKIISCLNEF